MASIKKAAAICGAALALSMTLSMALCRCAARPAAPTTPPPIDDGKAAPLVRFRFGPGEVSKLCDQAIAKADARLNAIGKLGAGARNIDSTLLDFEGATSDFSEEGGLLSFMSNVSTDPAISKEAAQCDEKIGQYGVQIFTRRDLYVALAGLTPRSPNEARLLYKTKLAFEQSGLKLDDAHLTEVKALQKELALKSSRFATNLNLDATTVALTAGELDGLPADYVAGLKKDAGGLSLVNTHESDVDMVTKNAKQAGARRKVLLAFGNRGGLENVRLLEEAIVLREKVAAHLGYPTWADYRLEDRMAKTKATVLEFLGGLRGKLATRNRADLEKLRRFKKTLEAPSGGASAGALNPWDVAYLSYQLKKRDYKLDNEKIREYFPADVVLAGLFEVYSKMLGVRFNEQKDAAVWAPDVTLYQIHDLADGRLIGHFYADLFPRPGKYSHAAAFTLAAGHALPQGGYRLPVSAIVANLTPPMNGKPSLLTHDDVSTLFHEFGHVMHQTLTKAPYASLSGASVAQDFVEAPSQMLENWVWSPQVLALLSGHYTDHRMKLPADLLARMIAARDFNQGVFYTRQLLFGLFDMTLHAQAGPVDTTKVYDELYRQIVGLTPFEGLHFAGSFGHLMGGYDAGYYGYLWSEVYAQDMFSKFPKRDLMNPEVGALYRKKILEPGGMAEAMVLLKDFLGREPSSAPFFKKLHIQ